MDDDYEAHLSPICPSEKGPSYFLDLIFKEAFRHSFRTVESKRLDFEYTLLLALKTSAKFIRTFESQTVLQTQTVAADLSRDGVLRLFLPAATARWSISAVFLLLLLLQVLDTKSLSMVALKLMNLT